MSAALAQPPVGSKIETIADAGGLHLTLPVTKPSLLRWLPALFLLGWMAGWAVGWWSAFSALFLKDKGPTGGGTVFLAGWLIAWTAGGVMAMLALYRLLQKPRPATLLLTPELLRYDPGVQPLDFTNWAQQQRRQNPLTAFRSKPTAIMPRAEAGEPKLARVGEELRLTIDHGVQRVAVGESLSEPELEWLAEILRRWKSAAQ